MRTACSVLLVLLQAASPAWAGPWRQAYVVDARLAALRAEPGLTAPIRKRLRAGRGVAIVGRRRDRDGLLWVRVAVTRLTRGWLLAEAIATPGDRDGERRLAALVDATRGLPRLQLARVALDRFPRLRSLAAAAMDAEAAAAAARLTRAVAERLGPLPGASPAEVRALMLSDPALDRYNRLGIVFEVDVAARRYVPKGFAGNR